MPVELRDIEETDSAQIRDIHESSGFDYSLPDLSSPLFLVRRAAEVDGRPAIFAVARVQAEIFLLVDHRQGEPGQRWDAMRELNEDVMNELYAQGIDEAVCWIPPDIEPSFAKRLTELGFERSRWQSWSRSTKNV